MMAREKILELDKRVKELERKPAKPKDHIQFSKIVVAAVMFMFFVGVALGSYSTVVQGTDLKITLDFIEKLVFIAFLGYFVKAFGENIFKIILPVMLKGRKNQQEGE